MWNCLFGLLQLRSQLWWQIPHSIGDNALLHTSIWYDIRHCNNAIVALRIHHLRPQVVLPQIFQKRVGAFRLRLQLTRDPLFDKDSIPGFQMISQVLLTEVCPAKILCDHLLIALI
jgi:hypothetical protein